MRRFAARMMGPSKKLIAVGTALSLVIALIPMTLWASELDEGSFEGTPVEPAPGEMASGGNETEQEKEPASSPDAAYESSNEVVLPQALAASEDEVAGIAPQADVQTATVSGVVYEYDGETLAISGSGKLLMLVRDTDPVKTWKTEAKHVVFTSADVTVYSRSFLNCTNLETVVFPEGLEAIGSLAFSGCSSLKSVTLPSTLTEISSSAFADCVSLESVVLPDGIEGIAGFEGCTGLKTVVLPANAKTIYMGAFEGCTSLQLPAFPSSLTEIADDAFKGCSAFAGADLVFPETMTTIGAGAFTGTNLKSVTLLCDDNSAIKASAFDSTTTVLFPNVVVLDPDCFKSNKGIYRVSWNDAAKVLSVGQVKAAPDGATFTAADLKSFLESSTSAISPSLSLSSVETLRIGDGITVVPGALFKALSGSSVLNATLPNVNSVVIGASVTTISAAAFWASGITSCTFENGSQLKEIGENAFADTNLTSLDLSKTKMESIGVAVEYRPNVSNGIFGNNTNGQGFAAANINLENITFPSTLHTIGVRAFTGCVATKDYVIPAQITTVYALSFDGVDWQNGSHLVVPDTVKTFTKVTQYSNSVGDQLRQHFDQTGATSVEFAMVKTPESVNRFPGYSAGSGSSGAVFSWSGYQVTLSPNNGDAKLTFVAPADGTTVLEALKRALPAGSHLSITADGKAASANKVFRNWLKVGSTASIAFDMATVPTDMLDLSIDWSNVLLMANGQAVPDEGDDVKLAAVTYNGALRSAADCFAEGDASVTVMSQATSSARDADESVEFAKDAGVYAASFQPKEGYCWADGTDGVRTYAWEITKAPLTATFAGGVAAAGQRLPLTTTVTGFLGGDSPDTIPGYEAPTVALPANFALVDTLLIPSGGNPGPNYYFEYVPGLLTVDTPILAGTGSTGSGNGGSSGSSALQTFGLGGSGAGSGAPSATLAGDEAEAVAADDALAGARTAKASASQKNAASAADALAQTGLTDNGAQDALPWYLYALIPLILIIACGIFAALFARKRKKENEA